MDQIHPDLIGVKEPNYEVMADAIYRAEGGAKARKPYGIVGVPVKDEAEARRVAINTARNNFQRWQKAGRPGTYIEFLANKYTPPSDDPVGNKNWKRNVPAIYAQLLAQQQKAQMVPVPPGYERAAIPSYKMDSGTVIPPLAPPMPAPLPAYDPALRSYSVE